MTPSTNTFFPIFRRIFIYDDYCLKKQKQQESKKKQKTVSAPLIAKGFVTVPKTPL